MRRKIPLCHAARQGRHDDPFKIGNVAIKRSAGLETCRLGRLAGVRVARAAHDNDEPGGMHSIHPGNPSITRATPPDPISNVRRPQTVNVRFAAWRGLGKQCGERRAAARISPSENNHDLEPIGQALFAGYFLSIPVTPVDDRCPIGQHLNRVKVKMVNAEG